MHEAGTGRQQKSRQAESMASYVGLDPVKEIHWVVSSADNPMELFANGKIDAFCGFPPEPQELHARKIGHVIVNTAIDRPWSQYFCCVLAGNRDFVRKHPVATKRVLRAQRRHHLLGQNRTAVASSGNLGSFCQKLKFDCIFILDQFQVAIFGFVLPK
jgi:hypothetical protein